MTTGPPGCPPVAGSRRHSAPDQLLRAVTSGMAGGEFVPLLAGAEYSLRLVALRAVLDGMRRCAPVSPLGSADLAWDLLIRVEAADPEVVRAVLTYPYVGSWARAAVRRLNAVRSPSTPGETVPLWAETGYLHCLAAAAAARAGIDFAIRVPAVDGVVVLPTLGAVSSVGEPAGPPGPAGPGACLRAVRARPVATVAVVASHGGAVMITTGGMRVSLPSPFGADAPAWRPVRSVRAAVRGLELSVAVDDVDPYRVPATRTPPSRHGVAQDGRWGDLLTRAWRLLVGTDAEAARMMSLMISTITPLDPAERFGPLSASSPDAFGSLLTSAPQDAAQLAAVLVHEVQHGKLGALMHLVPLHHQNDDRLYYAPWRNDPRPLAGLLQGIYAFAGVSWFWRAYRDVAQGGQRRLAAFEFALWRAQVLRTTARLRGDPGLTEFGGWLVERVRRWVLPWLAEPVPAAVRSAAELAVVEHRTGWRLGHLQPAPRLVEQLAAAWLAGEPARLAASPWPAPTVVPAARPLRLETTAMLLRHRMAEPHGFAGLRADPDRTATVVAGATVATLLVAAGEYDQARRLHSARVTVAPQAHDGWTGLALSLRRARPGGRDAAARAALLRHPELVRALACRLAAGDHPIEDPVRLAAWLTAGAAPDPA